MTNTTFYKRLLVLSILAMTAFSATVQAQELDVEVMERASDGLDTCAYGQVIGLKVDGDGFLAVRSGPASSYAKIDELKNQDKIWLFEEKDGWYGVVYDVVEISCSPVDQDRPAEFDGKTGWVYGKWVEVLAG